MPNKLKKYNITVEATIRKTYEVESDSGQAAIEQAQEMFSVLPEEGVSERYDQQLVSAEEVK